MTDTKLSEFEALQQQLEMATKARQAAQRQLSEYQRDHGGDPKMRTKGRKAARNRIRAERERRLRSMFAEAVHAEANLVYAEQYRLGRGKDNAGKARNESTC